MCGHHRKWHVMGVCRWCARQERRRPHFNWSPAHEFTVDPEVARRMHEDAVRRTIHLLAFNQSGAPIIRNAVLTAIIVEQ